MKRVHIINLIGENYLTRNTETDEFSYHRAFSDKKENIPSLPENLFLKRNNSERENLIK